VLYHIAVCDDDELFTEKFKNQLLQAVPGLNVQVSVHIFHDTVSLMEELLNGICFDLIFLDIYIKNENGYEFARQLRKRGITSDLIFITITSDYAVAGYEVSPLLYLIKPVTQEKLTQALTFFIQKHTPRHLSLRLSGELFSINISDILYLEVQGHTVSFYLISGKKLKSRLSLRSLASKLPSSLFVQSHQSYIVNLDHIESITRYHLMLSNKQILPISQSRYLELQKQFLNYSSHQKIWV